MTLVEIRAPGTRPPRDPDRIGPRLGIVSEPVAPPLTDLGRLLELAASGDVPAILRTVLGWLGAAKAGPRVPAERGA